MCIRDRLTRSAKRAEADPIVVSVTQSELAVCRRCHRYRCNAPRVISQRVGSHLRALLADRARTESLVWPIARASSRSMRLSHLRAVATSADDALGRCAGLSAEATLVPDY